MSEGMLGLLPLRDVRGPVDDLYDKLASAEGPKWLEGLNAFLRTSPAKPSTSAFLVLLPMPADFVPFTMKINGADPANHPLEGMVKGRDFTGDWKYFGKPVEGEQEAEFIWATCGYEENLKAKIKACTKEAKKRGFEAVPAEGQWHEEVIRRYQNNGVPRGVPDPSWEDPFGGVYFPCMHEGGDVNFDWAVNDLSEDWRLLFRVSK
mgnify:CR=1 FL=1